MFIVYSLEDCPYSINAEKLLIEKNLRTKIIPIKQAIKDIVKKELGNETFPYILYAEKKRVDQYNMICIGGYADLHKLLNTVDQYCELERENKVNEKMFKILVKNC